MKKALTIIIPLLLLFALGRNYFYKESSNQDFSHTHLALLTAIDQELKLLEDAKNESRSLSDNLIGKISKLSNNLKPAKLDDPSILTAKSLSPERGLLLVSLLEKKLSPATYQKIFSTTTFDHAFLEGVDLSNAPLDRILLSKSFFRKVNLSKASLVNANLFQVHFQNVNLRGADLQRTNLRDSNLDGSNLTKADLTSAYLRDADLKGVQIQDAILEETNLVGVNLKVTAQGLSEN